jgi:hypothetical protein
MRIPWSWLYTTGSFGIVEQHYKRYPIQIILTQPTIINRPITTYPRSAYVLLFRRGQKYNKCPDSNGPFSVCLVRRGLVDEGKVS